MCHCAGDTEPQVRGKLQHLSPLTSPLILTKCTERFRGILIRLMCISSPYLPFNTMTVIWQEGENKSRPNHRHPVSTEAYLAQDLCSRRRTMSKYCVHSWHICEHMRRHTENERVWLSPPSLLDHPTYPLKFDSFKRLETDFVMSLSCHIDLHYFIRWHANLCIYASACRLFNVRLNIF